MNEEVDMDMDNVLQGLEARIWSSGVWKTDGTTLYCLFESSYLDFVDTNA